jgi:radical SAM superfamily enzyme YgiQ (UPF0313 family)
LILLVEPISKNTDLYVPAYPLPIMEIGSYIKSVRPQIEIGVISMPVDYGVPLTREGRLRIHEEFIGDLLKLRPKGVGISCTAIAQAEETIALCERIKTHVPDVFTFLGGYFPTLYYEEIFSRTSAVDLVVVGEGEIPALRIAELLEEGKSPLMEDIPNTAWKEEGAIHSNVRRVAFDLTQRALLNMDLLRFSKEYDVLPYAFSRGCSFDCHFCMEGAIRPTRRVMSWEMVHADLTNLARKSMARTLLISDALFTSFDKLERLKGLGMQFNFETRCDVLDPGVIPKIAEQCGIIAMGLESASYNSLRRMNKIKNREHYERYLSNAAAIFREASRCEVPVMVFMIAGYPGDTEDDLQQSMAFAEKLSDMTGPGGHVFNIGECRIYPKTKLYHTASSMPEVVFDDRGVFADNVVRRPSRTLDLDTVMTYMSRIFGLSNNTPKMQSALSRVMPLFRIPAKGLKDRIIPDECFKGDSRDILRVQGESLSILRGKVQELRQKYKDALPNLRESRELDT